MDWNYPSTVLVVGSIIAGSLVIYNILVTLTEKLKGRSGDFK